MIASVPPERYKFFANIAYSIGGHIFTLNDIENGILRANRWAIEMAK